MNTYTEEHLVEQPALQLMQDELGWEGEKTSVFAKATPDKSNIELLAWNIEVKKRGRRGQIRRFNG